MGINAVLSFFIEIGALVMYALAPFIYATQLAVAAKWLVAVVLVVVFVAAWGRFAAPRSSTRLRGLRLVTFKFVALLPAAIMFGTAHGIVAVVGACAVVIATILMEWHDAT